MVTFANRVRCATTTLGTGTLALGPAIAGRQSFATAGILTGNTVDYTIEDGDAWEVGTGTYTAGAPDHLTRDQVYSSSSGGARIGLTGNAQVFVTVPATWFQSVNNLLTYLHPNTKGSTLVLEAPWPQYLLLDTANNAGVTGTMALETGESTKAASGDFSIATGTALSATSGAVSILTGSANITGPVTLGSGFANGPSGAVTVGSGVANGGAGSGAVTIGSGTGNSADTGAVTLRSGAADGGSGAVNMMSGTAAGGSGSGALTLASGAGTGVASGALSLASGNATGASSGTITLTTGNASGGGKTVGSIILAPGTASGGADAGHVKLANLPTADPGTKDGALWRDAGAGNVLKVSA